MPVMRTLNRLLPSVYVCQSVQQSQLSFSFCFMFIGFLAGLCDRKEGVKKSHFFIAQFSGPLREVHKLNVFE